MASGPKPTEPAEVIFLNDVRYERDPLSAVFQDLPDEELEMLAANIKAEGQKLAITINSANGMVLDGWQRLRACRLIEVEPRVVKKDVPNPAAFVMAVNEHRRGSTAQTATQRALLAADLLMLEWQARGGKGRKPSAQKTAEAAGTSVPTVEQVRRALRYDEKHGTDYEQRMRLGRLSAAAANTEIAQLQRKAEDSWKHPKNKSLVETRTPSIPRVSQTDDELVPEAEWKETLHGRLIALSPSGFEHFAAALLRADGFTKVEVMGGTGDGGIDGIATQSRIDPVSVAFQCKRYQGSVGAPEIRDFRGSFIGRCERGLLITTGTFTRSAKEEATRTGAHPVRLIDGDTLCDLLKEQKLGVQTEMIERVTIDESYFDQFEATT